MKRSTILQKLAGSDCHGTWNYWPPSGPVFLNDVRRHLKKVPLKEIGLARILFLFVFSTSEVPLPSLKLDYNKAFFHIYCMYLFLCENCGSKLWH